MKLLLPLDIAQPYKAKIEHLKVLLPLQEADVTLLYVKEEFPSYERVLEVEGDFPEDWVHQVESKAGGTLNQVAQWLRPLAASVRSEIVTGPAAMMIEIVARDEGFDLTAVTPGAHSQVELFLLGRVSSKVVKHVQGTVLICRPPEPPLEKVKNVVMGIDGSAQSRYALGQAVQQFRLADNDAQVTLIHVVSVAEVLKLVSPGEYISMVENNLLLEGETYLAEGKNLLAELGVKKVDCVLKEGDPATEIIKLADAAPADLVVIGAQGRTAVQHFLLGSVSHRIAMRAPCSTAVVKPPAQTEDA